MTADPIAVADVVLDAALAADAQTIVIEPAPELGRHTIVVSRDGEQLAKSVIDTVLAAHVVARLGYVCQVDRTDKRASIGRARVRSHAARRHHDDPRRRDAAYRALVRAVRRAGQRRTRQAHRSMHVVLDELLAYGAAS